MGYGNTDKRTNMPDINKEAGIDMKTIDEQLQMITS